MKKRIVLISLALILVLVAVPIGCAKPAPAPAPTPAPAPAPLPEIELTWNCITPAGSPYATITEEGVVDLIVKATHGRVKVTMHYSSTVVPPPDQYTAIQEGIVGAGMVWTPSNPGVFPLIADLFSLPGLFPNQATSNAVQRELYEKYPHFLQELSPKVKFWSTDVAMRADIHSTVPIRSVDELKGKLIACQDHKTAEALALLGGTTSTLPMTEMYPALERGIIDGIVIAWGAVKNWKFYEVTQYHTLISVSPGVALWIINRDIWDQFTPDEQGQLEMLWPEMQVLCMRSRVQDNLAVREENIYPDPKQEMIEWSAEDMAKMREAFRPIWDKWAEEQEARGIPGKDILKDAIRLIEGYIYG